MVIRSIPGDTAVRTKALADKAAAEIKVKSEGVDAANPGLQALVISEVEKAVAQDAWAKAGTLSTADVAGLKVKVASATAKALEGLAIAGPAQNAATALRHAERVLAQQAKVIDQISSGGAIDVGTIDAKELAHDLSAIAGSASNIGSLLAHDLWYADALSRTVQGAKSDDVGVDLGDGKKARARPFMAPSAVILESGDRALIKTMEGLNIAGVSAALVGMTDATHGRAATGTGDAHYASAKALPGGLEEGATVERLSSGTQKYLKALGHEIVEAHKAYARGSEPDWNKLELAHGALVGSHQRWLQNLSYEPGAEQRVGFDALSSGDKKNTVSSVMAAVFGAMKAGGMLPDELVAGVPLYLERSESGVGAHNVNVVLNSIGGKPAVSLGESGDNLSATPRFALRVDGKTVPYARLEGSRVAVSDVGPGSTVEVLDRLTGATRRLLLPTVASATETVAKTPRGAVSGLVKLEADLKSAGTRSREIVAQARALIGSVGADPKLHRELEAKAPALLNLLKLSCVGSEGGNVFYVDTRAKIGVLAVDASNAATVLTQLKEMRGEPTSDLRREVLKRGNLPTSSVYTVGEPPKATKWDYLDGLAHWTADRRELHENLFARSMALATGLNQVIGAGGKPTVFAMRGNTAVGKTRTLANVDTLKSGASFLKDNPAASINPDPIKAELVAAEAEHGSKVSSNQVHEEGSAISWRLLTALQKEALSMIVDRRLGSPNDVSDIVASAEANHKNVELIDVEAPLAFSVMGVLMRKQGGVDPIVPFDAIAYGFVEVRDGRLKVIERAIESDSVARYDLFATSPDGAKVCVAKKTAGQLEILDTKLFDGCVSPPHEEVELLRTTKIDAAFVEGLTSGLPKPFQDDARKALLRYEGMTLPDALEAHAK